MNYDSTADTLKHIMRVRDCLDVLARDLGERGGRHDQSKLDDPEKALFDVMTPKLKTLVYGSEEYKASLAELKPALDHHYAVNSHHPEHYSDGIDGMDLLDVLEMFCDWKAASERTKGGDFGKSIEIGIERFKIAPQLAAVLRNTSARYAGRLGR
jgi:hypothetical protein